MAATGGPAVDFITHAFLQFRNASVPVPRVALVDFSKAHNLSAGDDRTVELVVDAERRDHHQRIVREDGGAEAGANLGRGRLGRRVSVAEDGLQRYKGSI